MFPDVGGGVCEADELTSFGSVSNLYVHCNSRSLGGKTAVYFENLPVSRRTKPVE